MIRRALGSAALLVTSLFCLSCALWFFSPHATALETRNGATVSVPLPWRFAESGSIPARLSVALEVNQFTPRLWNLVPNDRLRELVVNGTALPLATTFTAHQLGDTWNGVEVDLGPYVHPGENRLEAVVENGSGPGGLGLYPRTGWRVAFLAVGIVPWLLLLTRWFRLDRGQLACCALGLLVVVLYWTKTPWNERSHDVGGHIEYIDYLLRKRLLPPPNGGWAFFHPPLFYLGGALVIAAGRAIHLVGYDSLQAYSLALWLVFLLSSAGTMRLVLRGQSLYVATLALALWPTAAMHGIRIGNDLMLYACCGVAVWFMISWWRSDRRKHLLLAAFVSGIAMLAKTNAIVLTVTLGGLFVLRTTRFARWRTRSTWLEGGLAALLTVTGVMLAMGNGIYYYWRGKTPHWLVANVGNLSEQLRVPNEIALYLALDVPTFLTQPWIDGRTESGRRNFWNAMLRTAVTGEWSYSEVWKVRIAYAWGVVLFLLICLLAAPALRLVRARRTLWREAPWLLLGFGWVASLMVLRYQAPFSCSNDFRYVLPVLVPFVVACVRTGALGRLLLIAMSVGTVPFVCFL